MLLERESNLGQGTSLLQSMIPIQLHSCGVGSFYPRQLEEGYLDPEDRTWVKYHTVHYIYY